MPNRILLTGAAGAAATGIRPLLAARGHRVVLLDIAPVPGPLAPTETAVQGSITDAAVLDAALDGVDLVVHLGGFSRERPWSDIAEVNIGGTQLLLERTRLAGVARVVLASSTHAVGFHPVGTPVEAMQPRPDTFYGVSKAAMEALGSVYADRFGTTVVAARIGTIEERPSGLRSLSTWLSFADFVRLIEATATTRQRGFHVVWAVSANTRGWFPLEAGLAIGYRPEDDAERFAPEIEASTQGEPPVSHGLIGGAFADDEHPLGGVW